MPNINLISAAERVVTSIMDEVGRLAGFSEIGAPLPSVSDVISAYRYLSSGSYIIPCLSRPSRA